MLPAMVSAENKKVYQAVNQLGINMTDTASDGELSDAVGLTTEFYPTLRQRKRRTQINQQYANITDVFEWDNKLIIVDGTTLYYDGEILCSVLASEFPGQKQFAVVNTQMIVWPDKIVIDMTNRTYKRMDEEISSNAGTASIVSGSVLNIVPNRLSIDKRASYGGGNYWYYGLSSAPVWQNGAWVSTGEITHAIGGIVRDWSSGTGIGDTLYLIPYKTDLGEYAIELLNYVYADWGVTIDFNIPPDSSEFRHEPNEDGVYCRIARIEANTLTYEVSIYPQWSYRLSGSLIFRYDLISAASGSVLLSDYFTVGDFVDITGLNEGEKSLAKITAINDANSTLTFPSGTLTGSGLQTNAVTVKRNIPALDYICAHENRLWGVSNSQENKIWDGEGYKTFTSRVIYSSALGLPMQFYDYSGVSTDAWAVAVGSDDDFTGIASYGGGVLSFKEHQIVKILGAFPAEYYMQSYTVEGVQRGSYQSLMTINDVLYYKGIDGVYAYTGNAPVLISASLGADVYTDGHGGGNEHEYVISMKKGDTWYLFAYDIQRGLWMINLKTRAASIIVQNNVLKYIDGDGKMWSADDADGETVIWTAEYAPTYETHSSRYSQSAMFNRKDYVRVLIRVEVNGVLIVEYRTDDGEWKTAKKVNTDWTKIVTVPLPPMRCDKFQLRLSGTGEVCIRSIERELTVGSEK